MATWVSTSSTCQNQLGSCNADARSVGHRLGPGTGAVTVHVGREREPTHSTVYSHKRAICKRGLCAEEQRAAG